jgi:predicted esterase
MDIFQNACGLNSNPTAQTKPVPASGRTGMPRHCNRPGVIVTRVPFKRTKATIVLLHGLYNDGSSFDKLADELAQIGCKVVAPSAPLRRLHWGDGDSETETYTWYDYYTKRDGENRHDIINCRHLQQECDYVLDIIQEHHVAGSTLILGGCSQGGTLVYHMIANGMIPQLTAAMISRSCFLHTLVPRVTPQEIDLLVFSAGADEVYCQDLRQKSLNHLIHNNRINLITKCKAGLRHGSNSQSEHTSFIEFVKNYL